MSCQEYIQILLFYSYIKCSIDSLNSNSYEGKVVNLFQLLRYIIRERNNRYNNTILQLKPKSILIQYKFAFNPLV